jgi:hypothetical protein
MREPAEAELTSFVALHTDAVRHFENHPELTAELGESPETAAMAIVASTIMNLDEFLTK